MRLIDADEIRIKPDFIFYGVCGTPVIRCEDLARIINEMPTIEPQKWIPCNDRLPGKLTQVIYSYENYVGFGYTTDRDYNGEETNIHWEDIESGALIYPEAWMPLPEPWKGEEE